MDGATKGKRGRKRQPDDDELTPEEKSKKQKNRDAAKKCREKKDREAKELKSRNEQLELENKGLSQEKNELKAKVSFYVKIIQSHLDRGCELPSNVKAIWDQEEKRFHDDSEEDMETSVAVDSLEQVSAKMHTPPHTPESSSNGKLSPDNSRFQISDAPTALFSGNPLPIEEMNKRRRCSSNVSSSPSSSPGPSPSPQMQSLTQIFRSKNIPPALTPIKIGLNRNSQQVERTNQIHQRSLSHSSVQRVPSVVEELESLSGDESYQYSSDVPEGKICWSPIAEKNIGISGQGSVAYAVQSVSDNEVIQRAMKQPDVAIDDEVARGMYMQPAREHSESNLNLPSLGFNISSNQGGYSFTQDLHNVESTEAIIKEVGMDNEVVHASCTTAPSQYSHDLNQDQVLTTTGNDAVQPLIEVCSPALLKLGPEMTWDLQQQIKACYHSRLLTAQRDQSSQVGSESSQAFAQKIVMTPGQMLKPTDEPLKQMPENRRVIQELHPGNKNLSQTGSRPTTTVQLSAFTTDKSDDKINENNIKQTMSNSDYQQQLAEAVIKLAENSQFVKRQTSNYSSKDRILFERQSTSTQLPQTATFATGHTAMQTIGVAESGSLKSLQSQDFSLNMQGLPSLGFNDLSSETNVFEKKPSNAAV